MAMMEIQESLNLLKQAQEIDREIYGVNHELELIPETLQDLVSAFENKKSLLIEAEARLKECQLRQKQKEGELAEKEGLIRKYDSQLMQVKTNKEYSLLQQEIASLKADGSLVEDAILVLLDEVEQAEKRVREERARIGELEKELQEKKEEWGARAEVLKTRLGELKNKRAEIMAQVPPPVRALYDKIIEKKQHLALVPVEGDACGACRMEIRPQLLDELALMQELVICENCSRILYLV